MGRRAGNRFAVKLPPRRSAKSDTRSTPSNGKGLACAIHCPKPRAPCMQQDSLASLQPSGHVTRQHRSGPSRRASSDSRVLAGTVLIDGKNNFLKGVELRGTIHQVLKLRIAGLRAGRWGAIRHSDGVGNAATHLARACRIRLPRSRPYPGHIVQAVTKIFSAPHLAKVLPSTERYLEASPSPLAEIWEHDAEASSSSCGM